jgi:hypothetical protein
MLRRLFRSEANAIIGDAKSRRADFKIRAAGETSGRDSTSEASAVFGHMTEELDAWHLQVSEKEKGRHIFECCKIHQVMKHTLIM